jgi:hypothetical protein
MSVYSYGSIWPFATPARAKTATVDTLGSKGYPASAPVLPDRGSIGGIPGELGKLSSGNHCANRVHR